MDSRGNDNKNHPCTVKILLATNTPLEVASTEGNTPLLRARSKAILKLLLRNSETQQVEIFGDIHDVMMVHV